MQIINVLTLVFCFSTLKLCKASPASADTKHSSRIVNGYEIDISSVPYQAALRRRVANNSWAHTCGAAIIHSKAVLTAGHCANGYQSSPSNLRVVVGTSFRLSGGKMYDVSTLFVHENYTSSTLSNDIAMIVTSVTITFSSTVQPVAYAGEDFYLPVCSEALVSGYGATQFEGLSSPVLLAAKVKTVSQVKCLKAYLRISAITRGMICASSKDPIRDACQGDSGGPLVSNGTLIGLVSWGEECAKEGFPGVYTRISMYSEWIRQQFFKF